LKKVLSILLIIAFLVQSTSQLWILVAFKINQEYIAANLCINRFEAIPVCKGSCFLEKQLSQDQKKQEKNTDLKLKEINLFYQGNATEQLAHFVSFNSRNTYILLNGALISSDFLRSVFRPPSNIV